MNIEFASKVGKNKRRRSLREQSRSPKRRRTTWDDSPKRRRTTWDESPKRRSTTWDDSPRRNRSPRCRKSPIRRYSRSRSRSRSISRSPRSSPSSCSSSFSHSRSPSPVARGHRIHLKGIIVGASEDMIERSLLTLFSPETRQQDPIVKPIEIDGENAFVRLSSAKAYEECVGKELVLFGRVVKVEDGGGRKTKFGRESRFGPFCSSRGTVEFLTTDVLRSMLDFRKVEGLERKGMRVYAKMTIEVEGKGDNRRETRDAVDELLDSISFPHR